jgi:hypothetical protein
MSKTTRGNMTYSDIDILILAGTSVLTVIGFVTACIYSKPHKSHVWEMNLAAGIKPQEGEQKKK